MRLCLCEGKMKQLFIGADPDIHNQSLVVIDELCNIVGIYFVRERMKRKGQKGRESTRLMSTNGLQRLFSEIDLVGTVAAMAVEGQNVTYTAKQGANPQNIVDLAGVAGGIMSLGSALHPNAEVYFPAPSDWKGTIPKKVHQCRTLGKFDLKYEMKGGKKPYPVPIQGTITRLYRGPDKINAGDWEDITDSLGLAYYARDRWLKEQKRKQRHSQ